MPRPWKLLNLAGLVTWGLSLYWDWWPGGVIGTVAFFVVNLGRRWPGWLVAAVILPFGVVSVALKLGGPSGLRTAFAFAVIAWVLAAIVRWRTRDVPSLSTPLIPSDEPSDRERLVDTFE